jgi:hypothetical protein
MSRIILSRHENGEEKLVVGWDRPLDSGFVDEYDDEGECIYTKGPISGDWVGPSDAAVIVFSKGYTSAVCNRVSGALMKHRELEYPESNVVEDWTKTKLDPNS